MTLTLKDIKKLISSLDLREMSVEYYENFVVLKHLWGALRWAPDTKVYEIIKFYPNETEVRVILEPAPCCWETYSVKEIVDYLSQFKKKAE